MRTPACGSPGTILDVAAARPPSTVPPTTAPPGRGRFARLQRGTNAPAVVALAACLLAQSLRAGPVDIELRPPTQTVVVGDTIDIGLYAVSADGTDQDLGFVGAVFAWDPAALALTGRIDNGPFAWTSSGFPSDSAGLNNDWTDGDAYYQAAISSGGARATATADGLLVTTLRFTALSAVIGEGSVSLTTCIESTCSRVLDRHPLESGVQKVTGALGGPANVVIHCSVDADCDDGNPCTDDTCDAAGACTLTSDDTNDPDDGLFCNGHEIACENGNIVVEAGSVPDCDDGRSCTTDACNEQTDQCESTIDAGSCLIEDACQANGTLNPGNDCEACDSAAAPTAWSARPADSPCGNQGEDACNHADTCDGFGACQPNVEPAGTPCGSQTGTVCTDPDTCDGAGTCLPNHASEGTPCDDAQFCTPVDTCQSGSCVGAGQRCPTGQVCNETLDECKAVNIEWRNLQPATAVVGEIVTVDLYAVSETGADQMFSSIGVIILWDPAVLTLLGREDNGPYDWLSSRFPDDSNLDGLNDTWGDGNALYQALGHLSSNPPPAATAAGLEVTTIRFEARAAGQTTITIRSRLGTATETEILDVQPPGLNITGTLGPAAAADVVDCFVDADCDDGQFCTGIETCVDNDCVAGAPPDCSDAVFCNGEEICDSELGCTSPGNPCFDPDDCDEKAGNCGGCEAPAVTAEGSRYLAVTPPAAPYPVALRVRGDVFNAEVSCLDTFIQPDGTLGPLPVYQQPGAWGTVHVTGLALQPQTRYLVHTDCSALSPGLFSAGAAAVTWIWGDVNRDGRVTLTDVNRVVDASQGTFGGGTTVYNVDLAPCAPDLTIDQQDNTAVQSAFNGASYPCPAVCAAPGAYNHCQHAVPVSEGSFALDTTAATTDGPDIPPACRVSGDPQVHADVWFCYTPSCTGTATISLCGGAGFNTKLAVYDGCACPDTPFTRACNDDFCGTQAEVVTPVSPCSSLLVRVGGFGGATGPATLNITCQNGPPADDCNGNGLPDDCDVAEGRSPDVNENGVPDECDPAIPAASTWGLLVLALLLAAAGQAVLTRRTGPNCAPQPNTPDNHPSEPA